MTKNFPEDILKLGCQTTVTVLCLEKDFKVKAMLDTGCSPSNYMRDEYFEANKAKLSQYEIGILKGLRFDMVIGLYAISFDFMEVIQDLLTVQLECLKAKDPELALLYGQPQQSFLAMMSLPGTDDSRSSTPLMTQDRQHQ